MLTTTVLIATVKEYNSKSSYVGNNDNIIFSSDVLPKTF